MCVTVCSGGVCLTVQWRCVCVTEGCVCCGYQEGGSVI